MTADRVVTLDCTARRNFKLKTRKTRSRWWSGGSTYCLPPRHYTVQSDRRILPIPRNILLPSAGAINLRAHKTHISSEHTTSKSKNSPLPLIKRHVVAFKRLITSSLLLIRHAVTTGLKF